MGKHTYSYNGILQEQRMNRDRHSLVDESHRRDAKLQQLERKESIQYGSICMKSKSHAKESIDRMQGGMLLCAGNVLDLEPDDNYMGAYMCNIS